MNGLKIHIEGSTEEVVIFSGLTVLRDVCFSCMVNMQCKGGLEIATIDSTLKSHLADLLHLPSEAGVAVPAVFSS